MENLNVKNLPVKYSILVNSCDSFEDCWAPFFKLLEKNWPGLSAPIYLNTEKKLWRCKEFELQCTQVQIDKIQRLSWSECLLSALEKIETPLVLYFQEDYFLHSLVNTDLVEQAAEYMIENPEVKRIALTRHSGPGPFHAHSEDWLQVVSQNARYRISTQASLWRVETLKSYINAVENGWMFEIFGTWRAHKRNDTFLVLNFDNKSCFPAIDYIHTGIIKGQWHQGMKKLFEENNIAVDFEKRGFHVPKKGLQRKIAVLSRLLQNPLHAIKEISNRLGL